MRWLLFLSRVAFICNIIFIGCLFLRYTEMVLPENVKGFMIVVGWIIALILNVVVNICVFVSKLLLKQTNIPRWLMVFNVVLLFVQVAYFMFF